MATPRFSPSRAMGIPARDYGSYFEQDVPTLNPDRGYSASPLMPTRFDEFANRESAINAKRDLEALEAQKDILEGKTDWLSPEGKDKRLNYLLQGAISPQQEYAMERMERTAAPNKYSAVPAEVVRATTVFEDIDPTDPEAWDQMTAALQSINQDPLLAESNVRAHPYLRETIQDLKRNILAARGTRPEDRDPRLWFATKGGDPDTFEKFIDPETGKPDRAKMAYELAKMKGREEAMLSSTERKILDQAAEDAQFIKADLSDENKAQLFKEKHGYEPQTEQDWSIAYELASSVGSAEKEKLRALIEDFERGGKTVPGVYKQLVGAAGEPDRGTMANVPQVPQVPQSSQSPVRVDSKEAYDALPSGTVYMDSAGNVRRKK